MLKKSPLFMLLFSFLFCGNITFASPIVNLSDTCTCYSTSMSKFDISRCEKVAAPRIVGIFADEDGINTINIQPGITYDAPVFKNYQGGMGQNAVGFRSPGPTDIDGSVYASAEKLPVIYAVPTYFTTVDGRITSALSMLLKENIDPTTCNYTPDNKQQTALHIIAK